MLDYTYFANAEEDNICRKQKERYAAGAAGGFIKMQKQNLNTK
jgi:hypothetical protein